MKQTFKKRKKRSLVDIVCTVCLTIFALLIIIPFWNAVVISLETETAYVRSPFSWWPVEFTLSNYEHLVESSKLLLSAYGAPIKITVIGTLGGMVIMVMAAYAFSRQFAGKKPLFMIMLVTMFFSGGMVPMYMHLKNLKILDTHFAVIMLHLVSVYNIIIMKNGFESTPLDLQEAAMIDGANDLKIFATVMLPLQKPLIATFSLFAAVGHWNNWYWPMLIINDMNKVTLQLYLRYIIASSITTARESLSMDGDATFAMGIQMASVFVVILPIMLVYPFLQKYFVKGMMVGAVKM